MTQISTQQSVKIEPAIKVEQLKESASLPTNDEQSPKYCRDPILQQIPSLAIKWPPRNGHLRTHAGPHHQQLQVLGEGSTTIDLKLQGPSFDGQHLYLSDEAGVSFYQGESKSPSPVKNFLGPGLSPFDDS